MRQTVMLMQNEAVKQIREANNIAIVTHISPDPDAVGSMLGLGTALEAAGKSVAFLCDDPVPQLLTFLTNADRVQARLPDDFEPELLIGLDASDRERLGKIGAEMMARGLPVLNVDHHITNEEYGDINVLADRASTAEMIVGLLDALELELTLDVASALMVGIVGDTRGFATSNVSGETLRDAARLVDVGIDASVIVDRVLSSRSFNSLRAWGLGLEHVKLKDEVIWATLPLGRKRRMGLDGVGTKGLSNFLLNAREAKISAVFTELADKKVEVSMRAKPGFDVATIALSLGGGGHKLAAGCTLEGSLEQATKKLIALLQDHIKQETAKGESD